MSWKQGKKKIESTVQSEQRVKHFLKNYDHKAGG